MKTVIKSHEFREMAMVKEFSEHFALDGNNTLEATYTYDYRYLSGYDQIVQLNGIMIAHRNYQQHEPLTISVAHDFPFFKMHFEYEGHSSYMRGNKGSLNADIPSGTHRLMFFPEVNGQLHYPSAARYTLEILLSLDFVQRLFNHDLSGLNGLGKAIAQLQPAMLSELSLPITPAMKQVIQSIIQCPYNNPLKRVVLEAKVTELLAMQLQQLAGQRSGETSYVRKDDIEKLQYVKELVSTHLQSPCSLIELAEMSGLNDFKLKRGFKELFGTTVFGYLFDLRMEKAQHMLLEGKQSIAEISFQVGYKNPQHFTAAFKRKYGCLPSEIKQ